MELLNARKAETTSCELQLECKGEQSCRSAASQLLLHYSSSIPLAKTNARASIRVQFIRPTFNRRTGLKGRQPCFPDSSAPPWGMKRTGLPGNARLSSASDLTARRVFSSRGANFPLIVDNDRTDWLNQPRFSGRLPVK